MRRISVVGNSGSGKTTFARELAAVLGIPHLELDSLHHLPNWQPRPRQQMRDDVMSFITGEAWVVDGNYASTVQDLVWGHADTVIWLDYPRARVLSRIIRRTVRRVVMREELWNGNREHWWWILSPSPSKSVVLWSLTRHRVYRERYAAATADPANGYLTFLRLRGPSDATALLRRTTAQVTTACAGGDGGASQDIDRAGDDERADGQ